MAQEGFNGVQKVFVTKVEVENFPCNYDSNDYDKYFSKQSRKWLSTTHTVQ